LETRTVFRAGESIDANVTIHNNSNYAINEIYFTLFGVISTNNNALLITNYKKQFTLYKNSIKFKIDIPYGRSCNTFSYLLSKELNPIVKSFYQDLEYQLNIQLW